MCKWTNPDALCIFSRSQEMPFPVPLSLPLVLMNIFTWKKERKGYLETLSFRCRRHLKWEAFQKWEAFETREEVGAEATGRVPKAKELKGAPSTTSTVSFPHCTQTMAALPEGEPCELTDYGITWGPGTECTVQLSLLSDWHSAWISWCLACDWIPIVYFLNGRLQSWVNIISRKVHILGSKRSKYEWLWLYQVICDDWVEPMARFCFIG